jgi:hypothetical protein
MRVDKSFNLVTAIVETLFAIPILGGIIILGMLWMPLVIMLAFHIVTLVLSVKNKSAFSGSVVGIIASVLGVIPILGWMLHLASAIVLWINFSSK